MSLDDSHRKRHCTRTTPLGITGAIGVGVRKTRRAVHPLRRGSRRSAALQY